jgi:quercetin dioxygenase-like cupin family protein
LKVVRLDEAVPYDPPKHTGVHGMHLQHRNSGAAAPFWVGCSYYLPGAKAEWDASPLHKVYIIVEGEMTIATDGEVTTLRPLDSVYLAPNERREVRNETNRVVTMLTVITYPTV